MKRALLFLCLAGCNNFNQLVERCLAEGRCGDGGGIVVGDPGVLKATPSTVIISSVIAETSAPQLIEIENTGPGGVENLAASLAGTNSDDFALTSACALNLAPSAKCNLTLTFTPKPGATGARVASIELHPARGSVLVIPIDATALPVFGVTSPVDFLDVTVGTQKTLTVAVTNPARVMRNISAAATSPYTVESNGCATVATMASCNILVRFEPLSQGQADGVLNLTLLGTSTNQSVVLKGRGVAPSVLEVLPPMPFNGEQIDAGTVVDRPFTVRNKGSQTIGPIVPSTASTGFSVLNTTCSTLDADASCTGTIRFAPPSFGTYPGQLDVAAGAAGTAMVPLLAHGTAVFTLTLAVSPAGGGFTVGADRIITGPCSGSCSNAVLVSPVAVPQVNVTASRTRTMDFDQWQGACAGDAGCSLLLDRDRSVTAVTSPVNVAFVSESNAYGGMGSRDVADQMCGNEARDAGFPGTFIALLSTSTSGALSRVPDAPGWIRSDGETFVKSRADLLERKFLYVLDRTARRVPYVVDISNKVYAYTTFLLDGGFIAGRTCNDWTSSSGTNPIIGAIGNGPTEWTEVSGDPFPYCNTGHRFYCLQTNGTGRALSPQPDGGHRVFVTRAYNDGGVADGGHNFYFDDACTTAAQALGYPTPYMAFVATIGASAEDRLDAGVTGPMYRPDGVLWLTDAQQLHSGGVVPLNPLTVEVLPNGGMQNFEGVIATGGQYVFSAGTVPNTCQDWTLASGSPAGTMAGVRSPFFYGAAALSCVTNPKYFICIPR